MKFFIQAAIFILLLSSCSSVQRNEKYIAKGDYDKAINLAIKKLQKNNSPKKNEEHILLLEDAFKKVVEQDSRNISFLNKQKDVFNSKEIFYLYRQLSERQELIRPLLPIYSTSKGKNITFKFKDYQDKLLEAKNNFTAHLYQEGKKHMAYKTTLDYRTAYNLFCELIDIQPNYKDSQRLLDDAHFLGIDHVFVQLINRSGKIIPFQLEHDLLNFDTYDLDTFWTTYHSKKQNGINYNFEIYLNFIHITISSERIVERVLNREKEIKHSWKYKKDREGKNILDDNGNPIKIDTYKTVKATVYQTQQTKSTLVKGNVVYRDTKTNKDIELYPLSTEFIFENYFAHFSGDKRALTQQDVQDTNNHYIPFPKDEQIVYDAGEDIKIQLKEILKDQPIK